MRTPWLFAGALAGAVIGRISAPSSEPLVTTAQPVALPVAAIARPAAAAAQERDACPPSAARAEAAQAALDIARVEREALASEAEAKAAALEAAQQALQNTTEPQRKSQLIREIAAHKSRDDLGGAWTWLAQHRTDPGYAENVRNVLYQWSYARPEHVAALLPQVASGEAQAAAAQQLAQLWHKKDPHAYQAWLASLPEGPLKAAARSPY